MHEIGFSRYDKVFLGVNRILSLMGQTLNYKLSC